MAKRNNPFYKNPTFWVLALLLLFFYVFGSGNSEPQKTPDSSVTSVQSSLSAGSAASEEVPTTSESEEVETNASSRAMHASDASIASGEEDGEGGKSDIITVDNDDEFAKLMVGGDYDLAEVGAFIGRNKGRVIQFEGSIDYMDHHGDYKTRYDMLLSSGAYDSEHQVSPTFKIEDQNLSYDITLKGDVPGLIGVGDEVTVLAVMEGYDSSTGIVYLDDVTLTY